jgi:two-component system LytT family response regulator
MTPISVMIIDDEAPARDKLKKYLANDPRFVCIAEAQNGEQAILAINQHHPKLLLLDIQMPGLSGFDVLRLMDPQNIAVIFTTAYDEYALDAFEVSAVDYLLKPISEARFKQALEKVVASVSVNWQEKISNVLHNLKSENHIQRLSVRHGQYTKIVKVEDIQFIQSQHRLIRVFTLDGAKYWTNEKLTDLERRLNPKIFMRIHRGSIINLNTEFDLQPWDSGRLKIHYESGEHLIVSREYTAKLKQWFLEQ